MWKSIASADAVATWQKTSSQSNEQGDRKTYQVPVIEMSRWEAVIRLPSFSTTTFPISWTQTGCGANENRSETA
jgi:hypothetical protein